MDSSFRLLGLSPVDGLLLVLVWSWIPYSCRDVVLVLVKSRGLEIGDLFYDPFPKLEIEYFLLSWGTGLTSFWIKLHFDEWKICRSFTSKFEHIMMEELCI